MIICPYCDAENISGVDTCDHCGQPLSDLHLPTPASHVEQCLLRDRLRTLPPNRTVTSVTPDTPVGDAVKLLALQSIGCVVVTENERLVGIFSERDVLMKLNARLSELAHHPVSEFMTANPQSLDREAKVAFALHSMAVGHYRHVPIVDEQSRPTFIISVRDVLQYLTEKMSEADDSNT